MTPDQYCQSKAAPAGSSLYYSTLFLPLERRQAVTAVHAFRREVKDAVDEASDPGVGRRKLAWWRSELEAVLAGNSQHPVGLALSAVMPQHPAVRFYLAQLLDGAQMDLDYNRYPDFPTLELYCDRAGAAWAASPEILGYSEPATPEWARVLGSALQLVEIVRDVGLDARRNRIYIPLDDLARFGLSSDDLIALHEDQRFERLMAHQLDRIGELFDRAQRMLPKADRRAQRSGLVMAAIYRALLREIASLRGRVLNRRIALTPLRKLWIAWQTK